MSGDTIIFQQGATFNVEGKIYRPDGTGFDYSDAVIGIYETLHINMTEIEAIEVDAVTGTFTVSISDLESKKLPSGRSSWFKLQLSYPDPDPQTLVFPPIWIDME